MRPPSLPRLALELGLAAATVLCAAAPASPQGEPGSRVDTLIRARYEEEGHRLSGEVTQTWTNATAETVEDLWFHLYHNAFSNTASTHLAETGGRLRGTRIEDGFGWQRVTSVLVGTEELLPSLVYRQPDDGNAEDRTVFSVDLPAPVGPGEELTVKVHWEARVPRLRRRTGYKDDFLFLAHWFPKLAVYEQGRGWNAHQFHANTEFYGNYGTYDVTLELPAKYEGKVFATGRQEGPTVRKGDYVVTRFLAPTPADRVRSDATGKRPLVHAFTWTADPKFKVRTRTFHYEPWAGRYREEVDRVQAALGADKDLALRTVEVTVLIQPEHLEQWERHFEATCAALFFYGLWFGEYPYEHVTVVDPAWGARQAGGMEYPTLFTAGTRMFTVPEMHRPESVTVHECGHQFWYGLVGNNEFEAAWLDEGFNSYTDSEVLVRHYGSRHAATFFSGLPYLGVAPVPAPGGSTVADCLALRRIPLVGTPFELEPLRSSGFLDWWREQPLLTYVEEATDPRWADRSGYLTSPDRDPIDTVGFEYLDRTSYSQNSYRRPAVALRTMPAVLTAMGEEGGELFLRGMRHYAESWRYRHPYPDDFFRAFNEGAGVDMDWYFDEVFRGTGTVDWGVKVEQRRAREPRGFFQAEPDGPFEGRQLSERQEGDGDALALGSDGGLGPDGVGGTDEDEGSGRPWKIEILVERRGELRLPLPIRWTFADGFSETRVWTREEQEGRRWLRIELEHEEKLESVVLDPERGYYLDMDMSDNAWFEEVDRVTPWRWTERMFTRYAHLLHWQAGIGG